METNTTQERLDFTLSRDAFYQLVNDARRAVPPVTDTDEDRTRRDNAVVAQIASLVPVSAVESNLAAQHVVTHAHAMEALRLATESANTEPGAAREHRRTAERMMRQSQSALRLLLRVQAERRRREGENVDQATLNEYAAMSLMVQQLPGRAAPPPPPPACEPESELEPEAQMQTQPTAQDDQAPKVDWVREAELYGVHYPRRAALIRRLGGLPARCSFGPPEQELVQALLVSKSRGMLALDQEWAGKEIRA